eukprot:SAG22_NODE_1897_length_3356_cov_3.577832_3_plen_69_part_00
MAKWKDAMTTTQGQVDGITKELARLSGLAAEAKRSIQYIRCCYLYPSVRICDRCCGIENFLREVRWQL